MHAKIGIDWECAKCYSSAKVFSRKLWVRSDKGMSNFFLIW